MRLPATSCHHAATVRAYGYGFNASLNASVAFVGSIVAGNGGGFGANAFVRYSSALTNSSSPNREVSTALGAAGTNVRHARSGCVSMSNPESSMNVRSVAANPSRFTTSSMRSVHRSRNALSPKRPLGKSRRSANAHSSTVRFTSRVASLNTCGDAPSTLEILSVSDGLLTSKGHFARISSESQFRGVARSRRSSSVETHETHSSATRSSASSVCGIPTSTARIASIARRTPTSRSGARLLTRMSVASETEVKPSSHGRSPLMPPPIFE